MDRKLIQYLPPVLREVLEFQAINEANEPELTLAWRALAQVMNNQFLESADESGVCVWEQELRIHPRDTDTLSDRKARIKELWNIKIPYTLPWLRRWLEGVCGPEGHEMRVEDYTLCIKLDSMVIPEAVKRCEELMQLIKQVLPSNLMWVLTIVLEPACIYAAPYFGGTRSRTTLPLLEPELPGCSISLGAAMGRGRSRTTLPMLDVTPPEMRGSVRLGTHTGTYMRTCLPVLEDFTSVISMNCRVGLSAGFISRSKTKLPEWEETR